MFRLVAGLVLFLTPALAAAQAPCLVGPHPGVANADAYTAAEIVCSHLRRQGVAVGVPREGEVVGVEAYRVGLRPLGRKLFVTVQHLDEGGTPQAEAEMLLQEIEEIPVAAPRLVESLLTGRPVAETARVSTLVGEEVRQPRKKGGETYWGLGFLGLAVPGTDAFPGAGFMLRSAFETEDFGVIGDLRFSFASPERDDAAYFSLGIGGRWFLTPTNWSPFLGVGMGWTALSVREGGFDGNNTGLGGWLEVGVEALRFYETRVAVELRAELPFYEIRGWDWVDLADEGQSRTRYYVPITLGVSYLW